MAENNEYIHAKEFLIDLACDSSTPNWLSYIIYGMIVTNGRLKDESLSRLAMKIVNGEIGQFDTSLFNKIPRHGNVEKSFKLKKLIHHSGVNALAAGVELKFCDEVTVLYGCNGSGKSGYFRILNELSGAPIEYEILPNIYAEPSDVSVHIDYEKDGQQLGFDWDGTRGSASDLNSLFVLDSLYAKELLNSRSLSVTAIEPFGLQMFRAITKRIDDFKTIIGGRISELRKSIPSIDFESLAPSIQAIIDDENLLVDRFNEDIKSVEFSRENQRALDTLSSKIQELKLHDVTALVRHKNAFQAALRTFLSQVQQVTNWLESTVQHWNSRLAHYASTYEAAKQAQNQYAVLRDIPGSDSDEWKEFIKLGVTYTSHHAEYYGKLCPYCHQPIVGSDTLELLQNYVKFLEDKTQQECSAEWQNVSTFQKSIQLKSVELPSLDSYKPELDSIKDGHDDEDESGKSLYDSIEQFRTTLVVCKKKMEEKVSRLEYLDDGGISIGSIEQSIQHLIDCLEEEIKGVSSDVEMRQKEIQTLENQRKVLEQTKSLVSFKSRIEERYKTLLRIRELDSLYNSITSRRVSDLSRIAHAQLLTANLKTKFAYWLSRFDFPNLSVALEIPSIVKGAPLTELHLTDGTHSVKAVLSEGEQKAVSLAMFLTEAEVSRANVPLVFDDPVNSLDNRVIEKFARMLMELDQQVIVFTHNRLLLDALQVPPQKDLWHICKNYNNGCSCRGKHIYLWDVVSFNGRTGFLTSRNGDGARDLLERSFVQLRSGILNNDERLMVAANMRQAIEKIIDEKLLKNIRPCKYNVSKGHIDWPGLARLNADQAYQRQHSTLQESFGKLSNRELHDGSASREVALVQSDLQEICTELLQVLDS